MAATASGAVDIHGQASSWLSYSHPGEHLLEAGLRYIPSVELGPFAPGLDAELSVNGLGTATLPGLDSLDLEARLKPYRLWLRFSTNQFEARAGLQKLTFGSATLLRPLMWFDGIDPRDPLGLTHGVYALLARYYFLNNTNLWAWALLGNQNPRGFNPDKSVRWSPELGGRAQFPVPAGEVAVSLHHRQAVSTPIPFPENPLRPDTSPETRLGLDGRWDFGIGLWFEGSVSRQIRPTSPHLSSVEDWQRLATLGADYTIPLGNGLLLLAEHFVLDDANGLLRSGLRVQASALMVSYSLTIFDNLQAFIVREWRYGNVMAHLSWQRNSDNWTLNLAGFANPDVPAAGLGALTNATAGKGVRLLVAYHH